MNATAYMGEVLPKLKSQRVDQQEETDKDGDLIPDTYKHNLTLADPDIYYHTWEVPSPLNGITLHDNYNTDNAMYIVCG